MRQGPRQPPVETAAYFVACEALANTVKHAQASSATVSARRSDGVFTIEVADDGVGGAEEARGTGLRGLGDRVEALDGMLVVESPPGRGTRVRAVIPIPARAARERVRLAVYQGSQPSR